MLPRFSDDSLIADADFSKIAEYIANDLTKMNQVFSSKIDRQRQRYHNAYKGFMSDTGFFHLGWRSVKMDVELSNRALSLLQRISSIDAIKDSVFRDQYSQELDQFVQKFHECVESLSKDMKEIEKYHNENRRYSIAKIALVLSFVAFLLSQLKNAYESWILLTSFFSK